MGNELGSRIYIADAVRRPISNSLVYCESQTGTWLQRRVHKVWLAHEAHLSADAKYAWFPVDWKSTGTVVKECLEWSMSLILLVFSASNVLLRAEDCGAADWRLIISKNETSGMQVFGHISDGTVTWCIKVLICSGHWTDEDTSWHEV